MRRIPEIYRLALAFSGYIFATLAFVFGIFFFLYQSLITRQNWLDFDRAMREIIDQHLQMDASGLQFVIDSEGNSLKQQLTTEGMSAIFLDASGKVIRQYGLFALTYNQKEAKQLQDWQQLIVKKMKPQLLSGVWLDQPLQVFLVPLKRDNQLIGILLLSRSESDMQSYGRIMLVTMATLLGMNLLLSFGIGTVLARSMLRPVRKMAQQVQTIDLDRIETNLPLTGHPQDATLTLSLRINDMLQRLKSAADKQKSFVSQASHELKTPLTRVISALELGLAQPTNLRDKANQAVKELFRLADLVEQLLIVARLNKLGNHDQKFHRIDFKECITQAINVVLPPDSDRIIKVEINTQKIENINISAVYLRIIIQNLLQNAIKYSQPHTEIILSVNSLDPQIELQITDQGRGIDQAEIAKVTDPFYRGKLSSKMAAGYGVGLSLVNQICQTFGVKFIITSQINVGTNVRAIFQRGSL